MTETRKLEINLAEKFPHLAHAPIVEAVIDIRARAQAPWEEAGISQRLKPQLLDYPKADPQGQVQHEITFGADQPKSATHHLGWHGLRFQSSDGKQIAQFTRDGFLFARLQPYENWECLLGEAMRLWKIHAEAAQPLEAQRIGLRFVNRIFLETGWEEYIEPHAVPPRGLDLPISGFLHVDTLVVPGYDYAINVVRTIQPAPPQASGPALILDNDVFTTQPFQLREGVLETRLAEMRWLKNKVFFGNIRETVLDRFE